MPALALREAAAALLVLLLIGCAKAASTARPELPDQFVVQTGITMPFEDLDPVAQSGAIYYDRQAGQLRIDNFWLGTQRTLLVDLQRKRAHLINEGVCVTSIIKGRLMPVAVPEAAARDRDVNAVRGVNVDHFHHVVREEDLVHIDYYFRRSNFSARGGDPDAAYWLPWRITSRRVERQEMIAAPGSSSPNWRFFGEPFTDALVKFGPDGRAVTRLMRDVTVTIDFYNFCPMAPDPSVFETPEAICKDPPSNTFDKDFDVFDAQRSVIELSFNNEAGHRLVAEMTAVHDHELPPGESSHPETEL